MCSTVTVVEVSCAVHATLPLGRGYTTLEIKVNYLRAVTAASGPLTAVGEVVHAGRRQAVAEARLSDGAGRLCATASTTCLLIDLPPPATEPVVAARTRVS
ncbi:PaaI family thioesterase [Methylobacterium oryzae CBMB20]